MFSQRVSSENVRFSRSLTHASLLRATKGDVDDIETSLLSQVVAKQQLEILEEEEKQQETTTEEQTKVKRKEIKWEPQQHEADKEAKTTPAEEIHKERQQEERRKVEGDKISESNEMVTVEVQDSSNPITEDTMITDKQQQQKKSVDKQAPTKAPTILFKQLKDQYQSISEKLKEQEERELARRATLESRKKDAAQIRAARQSQRRTEVVTNNEKNEEGEESNEIVIQLDQMGSYAAFNDNDRHDNATMTTHKKHTQSTKSSVGDDEYYQQMTSNTTHVASKAT